jgi:hypothetical protein
VNNTDTFTNMIVAFVVVICLAALIAYARVVFT